MGDTSPPQLIVTDNNGTQNYQEQNDNTNKDGNKHWTDLDYVRMIKIMEMEMEGKIGEDVYEELDDRKGKGEEEIKPETNKDVGLEESVERRTEECDRQDTKP